MKHLYLIGGTMGVGKTTAGKCLKAMLERSVFLDGDWCWDMNPFLVTPETKKMVLENICFLLQNFLSCPALDHVIFCWVLHQQEILEEILSRLGCRQVCVHCVSLVCTPEALRKRLEGDIRQGIRDPGVLTRSMERLPLYETLDTVKIQVSGLTPKETAERILEEAKNPGQRKEKTI